MLSSPGVQETLDQVLIPYSNCVKWAKYDALKFLTSQRNWRMAVQWGQTFISSSDQSQRKLWISNWEGCQLQCKYSSIQKKKNKFGANFNSNNNRASKIINNHILILIRFKYWERIPGVGKLRWAEQNKIKKYTIAEPATQLAISLKLINYQQQTKQQPCVNCFLKGGQCWDILSILYLQIHFIK